MSENHDDYPAQNHHVIARSLQATWQSRQFSGMLRGPWDCHALRARNDVVIWWLVLLIFAWRSSNAVGGGNAARPTVRIPYAERMLATGLAVLLDGKSARSIRLEFAPGQARYAERKLATSREGPMV